MKISLKLVVFAILGVFLVKISIADSWQDKPVKSGQLRGRSLSSIN